MQPVKPDIHGILLHGQAIAAKRIFVARYQKEKTGEAPSLYDNYNPLPFKGTNPTDCLINQGDIGDIAITNKNIHIASTVFACLDALVRLSMSTSVYTHRDLKLDLESKIQHWETIVIDILSSLVNPVKAKQLVNFALDLFEKGIPSASSLGEASSTEIAFRQEGGNPGATRDYWAKILAAADCNRIVFRQQTSVDPGAVTYLEARRKSSIT
jgi:hypothetical protein